MAYSGSGTEFARSGTLLHTGILPDIQQQRDLLLKQAQLSALSTG